MMDLHDTDGRKIVRLMQRRECNQPFQTRHHGVIDQDRPRVIRSSLSDAMSHGQRVDSQFVPQPGIDNHACRRNVIDVVVLIGAVRQRIAVRSARSEARMTAEPVKPSLDLPLQPPLVSYGEELEVHTSCIRIDGKDRVHGGQSTAVMAGDI